MICNACVLLRQTGNFGIWGWGEQSNQETLSSMQQADVLLSKLSIHTVDPSSHRSCKVITKLRLGDQAEPPDVQRYAAFKFIVTEKPRV